ncbi:sensor domain-containing diguanylate cyclase [Shewanella youngdeokensis]|uniref:diguanylate cyclase n=1 Tax=Shewanella youngdeokensis TaxID=2999068 RepID=A0ABZ0K2E4_9GAMM|nr:sensor domain-containing diguanylate cyclase [Shewanella sp. DAU334]
MFPINDSLKNHKIDTLNVKTHLALLGVPLLLLVLCWALFFNADTYPNSIATLALISIIYVFGYCLTYYVHQGRITRLWEHLQQVRYINATTFELINMSSQYQEESDFLDALLKKAVSCIDGAEMGSIIKVEPDTGNLYFEAGVGVDLAKLQQLDLNLKQSFEYRLTNGLCNKVVVIDDMQTLNSGSSLTQKAQQLLLEAPSSPVRSTLSSPIHIDGKLYVMLNLDSSTAKAFSHYDRNLVSILTHEAANAIALYQKNHKIQTLANFDRLTGLYNRQRFEVLVDEWRFRSHSDSFLILIDMDNLKQINDHHGHQAGDAALQQLGQALKVLWHEQHLVARFGGDEFIALCHGSLTQIENDLGTIQDTLRQQGNISFSYGIEHFNGQWNKTLKAADDAMYCQKRAKKP